METKIKLSDKQKEVIRKARKNNNLISGESINWKLGHQMRDMGLVKFVPFSIDYELTEFGKTIPI